MRLNKTQSLILAHLGRWAVARSHQQESLERGGRAAGRRGGSEGGAHGSGGGEHPLFLEQHTPDTE